MKPKKLAKIQARARSVFTSILGDTAELRFRPDGLTVDVRFCSRVECEGCDKHTFGIAHLEHPDTARDLPPLIYENVAKAVLQAQPRRRIGF